MNEAAAASADPSNTHGEHPRFLAHHFDTPQQQFDTGKLGMWLFLVTEILFFSGLFVFYAVYRSSHPEVFVNAHQYLEKSLGAFNTVVLLFSSLTMAWGVRCAQLGQRRGLVLCLTLTLVCASLFLGVKAVEYTHKWDLGLYWGKAFAPIDATHGGGHHGVSRAMLYLCIPAALAALYYGFLAIAARLRGQWEQVTVAACLTATALAFFLGVGLGYAVPAVFPSHAAADELAHEAPVDGDTAPAGTSPLASPVAAAAATAAADAAAGSQPFDVAADSLNAKPNLTAVFFSIYYSITGLHAIHILAGIAAIAWLLKRAVKGHFDANYFGPVDYVGLYWHLVDLIWIFLFPLLYLIH